MSEELKACPFCGGRAEIRDYRYQGTGASGMETPNPYGACAKGCVSMKPVPCDDSPYGRKVGALTYKQARANAVADWNTRTPAPSDAARTQAIENAARRVLSIFEVARSPHGAPSRAVEPPGATEALDALMVAVESPVPTPSPMETAAVEELIEAMGRVVAREPNVLSCDRAVQDEVEREWNAARAALTRLLATTTSRDAAKDGGA